MPKVEREKIARLEDLPNIGKAGAADLRSIGIQEPAALIGKNPIEMYDKLCHLTGKRQDPCVLDVFMSAVRFTEVGATHGESVRPSSGRGVRDRI
jgi:hypothetical protein